MTAKEVAATEFAYDTLVLRNSGYVSSQVQSRIADTRLLIAGCGIGSALAEAAVRLGFQRFILVDGDVVDLHNLNRQDYTLQDIGDFKVKGLADRILSINPQAQVEQVAEPLTIHNVDRLVLDADMIFDTIDFLDVAGIVALHDAARLHAKPIITALSIGWGAGCVYFPTDTQWTFRRLFGLPEIGSLADVSYVAAFAKVIERLAAVLDPDVVQVVSQALTVMQDGHPCPASQVAPGASTVGALAATLMVQILAGESVREAPNMSIVDLRQQLKLPGLDLS